MPAATSRTIYAIYTSGRNCQCRRIRPSSPITTVCHGNTHALRPAIATLSCPGRPPASCDLPHCSCPGNRWQRQALPLPRCRPSPPVPRCKAHSAEVPPPRRSRAACSSVGDTPCGSRGAAASARALRSFRSFCAHKTCLPQALCKTHVLHAWTPCRIVRTVCTMPCHTAVHRSMHIHTRFHLHQACKCSARTIQGPLALPAGVFAGVAVASGRSAAAGVFCGADASVPSTPPTPAAALPVWPGPVAAPPDAAPSCASRAGIAGVAGAAPALATASISLQARFHAGLRVSLGYECKVGTSALPAWPGPIATPSTAAHLRCPRKGWSGQLELQEWPACATETFTRVNN